MYYIFTVNNVQKNSEIIQAEDIAERLISKGVWIFREGTPLLRYLNIGDKVLIYLCGHGRRYFHSVIEIKGNLTPFDKKNRTMAEELGIVWMTLYTEISIVKKFAEPIHIKPLIQLLHFILDKKNYGLNLRLPIIHIQEEDYMKIINAEGKYFNNAE